MNKAENQIKSLCLNSGILRHVLKNFFDLTGYGGSSYGGSSYGGSSSGWKPAASSGIFLFKFFNIKVLKSFYFSKAGVLLVLEVMEVVLDHLEDMEAQVLEEVKKFQNCFKREDLNLFFSNGLERMKLTSSQPGLTSACTKP